jgi:hypothetical protein
VKREAPEGNAIPVGGVFADTWIKVESGWQCVASQSTLVEK